MAKPKIVVCLGSSCFARGNEENIRVVEAYLKENSYQDDVDVELSGTLCQGRCADGPNVIVDGKIYSKVERGSRTRRSIHHESAFSGVYDRKHLP